MKAHSAYIALPNDKNVLLKSVFQKWPHLYSAPGTINIADI